MKQLVWGLLLFWVVGAAVNLAFAQTKLERYTTGCEAKQRDLCWLAADAYQRKGDMQKAITFYRKACALDEGTSCHQLGMLYTSGKHLSQSLTTASEFFTKACAQNIADSCYNLGVLFQHGYGVQANAQQARDFFTKACDLQHEKACERAAQVSKN